LAKICCICNKKLGKLDDRWGYDFYMRMRVPLPEGMSEPDVTCSSCYRKAEDDHKVEMKKAKMQSKKEIQDLYLRTPEYKKKWNKYGIIQFKNERIAILQRAYGAQVEFIIAFDDLTSEGYELKAIDEGKEGDTGVISGGINSYYYFQKNNSILFPSGRI
jgi:hypothetical protein